MASPRCWAGWLFASSRTASAWCARTWRAASRTSTSRSGARAVAMVADQEPPTSEQKYWTRFLNRDTAFYLGPEEIARVTRFPVFFISMRRTGRGYYEMRIEPLAAAGEVLSTGALTERYARLVEQQIHDAPSDWPWSHKRWKLRRSVYQSRARQES